MCWRKYKAGKEKGNDGSGYVISRVSGKASRVNDIWVWWERRGMKGDRPRGNGGEEHSGQREQETQWPWSRSVPGLVEEQREQSGDSKMSDQVRSARGAESRLLAWRLHWADGRQLGGFSAERWPGPTYASTVYSGWRVEDKLKRDKGETGEPHGEAAVTTQATMTMA